MAGWWGWGSLLAWPPQVGGQVGGRQEVGGLIGRQVGRSVPFLGLRHLTHNASSPLSPHRRRRCRVRGVAELRGASSAEPSQEAKARRGATSEGLIVLPGVGASGRGGPDDVFRFNTTFLLNLCSISSGHIWLRHLSRLHRRHCLRHALPQVSQVVVAAVEAVEVAVTG